MNGARVICVNADIHAVNRPKRGHPHARSGRRRHRRGCDLAVKCASLRHQGPVTSSLVPMLESSIGRTSRRLSHRYKPRVPGEADDRERAGGSDEDTGGRELECALRGSRGGSPTPRVWTWPAASPTLDTRPDQLQCRSRVCTNSLIRSTISGSGSRMSSGWLELRATKHLAFAAART